MAQIILRGWRPDSRRSLIPLIKALRDNLPCPIAEAVGIAEECTDLGRTMIRDGVPPEPARRLLEELRSLDFDIEMGPSSHAHDAVGA